MKAKGFNWSLINVKEEAKKHLTYRLKIHIKLLSLKFGKFGSTVRIKCMAAGILIVVLAVFLIYM